VDGDVASDIQYFINLTTGMIAKLVAIMVFTPVFVVPSLLMGAVGSYLGKYHDFIAFDAS
jgi:hypothetical protein